MYFTVGLYVISMQCVPCRWGIPCNLHCPLCNLHYLYLSKIIRHENNRYLPLLVLHFIILYQQAGMSF